MTFHGVILAVLPQVFLRLGRTCRRSLRRYRLLGICLLPAFALFADFRDRAPILTAGRARLDCDWGFRRGFPVFGFLPGDRDSARETLPLGFAVPLCRGSATLDNRAWRTFFVSRSIAFGGLPRRRLRSVVAGATSGRGCSGIKAKGEPGDRFRR